MAPIPRAARSRGAEPIGLKCALRCTPLERARIRERAAEYGMSVSAFLVACALNVDEADADEPRLALSDAEERLLFDRVAELDRLRRMSSTFSASARATSARQSSLNSRSMPIAAAGAAGGGGSSSSPTASRAVMPDPSFSSSASARVSRLSVTRTNRSRARLAST